MACSNSNLLLSKQSSEWAPKRPAPLCPALPQASLWHTLTSEETNHLLLLLSSKAQVAQGMASIVLLRQAAKANNGAGPAAERAQVSVSSAEQASLPKSLCITALLQRA